MLQKDFLSYPDALYNNLLQQLQRDKRVGKRKTASYGIACNYSGISYPNRPMHPLIMPVSRQLACVLGYTPNNCLVNFYQDAHSDNAQLLEPGTGVAIISLGSERDLLFTNKQDKSIVQTFNLTNGSLLYMDDLTQHFWSHAIPASEDTGGRISLTFRMISGSSSRQLMATA